MRYETLLLWFTASLTNTWDIISVAFKAKSIVFHTESENFWIYLCTFFLACSFYGLL